MKNRDGYPCTHTPHADTYVTEAARLDIEKDAVLFNVIGLDQISAAWINTVAKSRRILAEVGEPHNGYLIVGNYPHSHAHRWVLWRFQYEPPHSNPFDGILPHKPSCWKRRGIFTRVLVQDRDKDGCDPVM